MTPSQLLSYIRFEANVSTASPFDNTTLLPIVNAAKDSIAQAIIQVNPDYFGEVSSATTVSSQQEYTKPDGLILFKRADVAYADPTIVGNFKPARKVTLEDLKPYGEDYYAKNQPTSSPLIRFDDTGLFIYPTPTATTAGTAYIKLWWIPKRTDLTDLSDSTNDIEYTTGIGGIFHQNIGDIVINWILRKKGELTALDIQNNERHILDNLVPSAFRTLSTTQSNLPNDVIYQY